MTKPAIGVVIGKRISSPPSISLPRDTDDILRLGDIEIWLYDPSRSLYKLYTENEEVLRLLMNAPARFGVKEGATYSKGGQIIGRDFLVRYAEMADVLRHLEEYVKLERKSAKTTSFPAPEYELSHRTKGGRLIG